MGDFENDHHYSELTENSALASGHYEKKQQIPVISPRRLRDREALKRKREEAQDRDTFQQDFGNRHQKKSKGTGRGRRKQVKEPEPEPQPGHQLEPKHEPEIELEHEPELESRHELKSEKKSDLVLDVPQDHDEHEQGHLEHQEPFPHVTEDEDEDVTVVVHEEEGGYLQEKTTSFLKDKEEVAEVDPEPATAVPEVLSFSLSPEEEHQYYNPLL
ncbi:uncharacterized protein LOC134932352 isoform X2 [Pseudophryne corroboree]|uniref:uncharacterized protein LOC134932352 isoform X2 n=1 Tax=Pseudophryne corroboree TaxID=495146 RepID=UPI003082072F